MNYEEQPRRRPEASIESIEPTGTKNGELPHHKLLLMLMAAMSTMIFAVTADAETSKPQKSPRKSSAVMEKPYAQNIRSLQKKYGIVIETHKRPRLGESYAVALLNETDYEDVLRELEEALSYYPPDKIRDSTRRNKRIYILDDLHRGNIPLFGMLDNRHALVLTRRNLGPTFHHEWFHRLDEAWNKQQNDDSWWISLNPEGKKAYHHLTTDAALEAPEFKKRLSGPPPKGFASKKGQYQGPSEDQAVTAEALFDEAQRRYLLRRAVSDMPLRRKIETITGCRFDPKTRRFISTMSAAEYKKYLGSPNGIEYYGKWFVNKQGKPIINHTYWNALIDGKRPYRKNSFKNEW